ncbi:NAD(P)H-dependent oxidoreductase [Flavobacteriaceae bacterium]|nr:NAD(P)H-dependent oxidoreductase [Flavobacteriaceae bacterium]MDA9928705.1 NAD(P)H-dependent oxidoreductase [Flavobacteriaceae bacterium]MDC6456852.1 NAD(P)H-dependent oxidoreductase [Flavobacteriaceae bacterium]
MNNILDALEWRYAVKKFDDKASLTEQQILEVKKVFNLSASSYGLQPYKMIVVQNPELKEKLVPASLGQQQISQSAAILVFAVRTDFGMDYIDQFFKDMSTKRQIPLENLEGYKNFMKGSFANKSEDEISSWATKQVYLTMGHMLASLAALQIDACPMEGLDPQAYDKILDLDAKQLKTIIAMPIGVRAPDDASATALKVRKDLSDIIIDL